MYINKCSACKRLGVGKHGMGNMCHIGYDDGTPPSSPSDLANTPLGLPCEIHIDCLIWYEMRYPLFITQEGGERLKVSTESDLLRGGKVW